MAVNWLADAIAPRYPPTISKVYEFPEHEDNLREAFQYRSLGLASGLPREQDDADIRLLEIFPSPTRANRVRCAIHHYCFLMPAQRISYTALSYVWSNQDQDRLIVVDGRRFLVTKNMKRILSRLRDQHRSVFVWIDAICIFQRMIPEKQKQIAMMDSVYGTTDEVIAYLGEAADSSEMVVHFADVLLKKFLALENIEPNVEIQSSDLERFGLPPVSHPGWKALRAVFERPWFERKWVIQECVHAKLIICILGDSRFNFELLTILHKLCLQHRLDSIVVGDSSLTIPRTHPLTVLSSIRDRIRYYRDEDSNVEPATLPWLLAATSYAKASRAHDHIYALLSLDQSELSPPYPPIDYDRSVENVYIDYACKEEWKELGSEVSLLELASQGKTLVLPSWVPDWTRPISLEYTLHSGCHAALGASGGEDRAQFAFDRDAGRLSVRAVMFDHITEFQSTSSNNRAPELWAEEYESMEKLGFDYITKLGDQICCSTSSGHRILVQESSRVDDCIVIIYGERVPFVVRRHGPYWKLVGCAYFSSIMQGEVLNPQSRYFRRHLTEALILV